ncbi:MAG TPA: hypothetical protein VFE62_19570 [Gemmataceae bacterium]|nr:hypothetical protein [Gemmataceae bacterium]
MRLSWPTKILAAIFAAFCLYIFIPDCEPVAGQEKKQKKKKIDPNITFPPKLPDGKTVLTVTSDDFLKAPPTISKDVLIAKTAPTVDFLYYPCQTYEAKIWSNWGDGLAINGKYYSSVGDHNAPKGNAFVYEYDPAKKALRLLTDIASVLGNLLYLPGKIHGRLDMGKDGFLYFSTHRGATNVTTDKYEYKGDWIIKCDPNTPRPLGEGPGVRAEVVAHGPVPKHCIPNSVLDPDRLIFYGGTAPGVGKDDAAGVMFFAYDVANKKLLYSGKDGPPRYMIFAKSTGRIYYVPGSDGNVGPLMRYDPAKPSDAPVKIAAQLGLRSATQETRDGLVYTCSKGSAKTSRTMIYSFNTKTEEAKEIGPAAVGTQDYITSIDVDPTGRYLYYIPGAHGHSENDGSAVVQFDTKTKTRKVIAFLSPYFKDKIGATPTGTFSSAIDPAGDKLYITWNVTRGSRAWDCCALTVIHIPEGERVP